MTRPPASGTAGYSLVEVLVVMTLIALVSGGVWIAFGPDKRPGEAEAGRLAVALMRAEQEAILSGEFVGLDIEPGSTHFLRFRDGEWQADPSIAGGGLRLDEGLFLRLAGAAATEAEGPDLWLDPTGASDPATLLLDAGEQRYRIEFDAGRARVEAEG
ncbi:GspH/FimT family pseudopilin [Hyphobacterium marinum]|uniref:Type II secretion system protein H n=1 Tax=Hyphobacterium marinum TaxID=3116574 RepID=A0ABU7LW39_9PROT|nr:GspH/FimT family pseudopilin [Hyphobacterium sp. Y6023]MEE2565762.1 GspH/FimT family pseudopilin [Hyphobacterium sp. Y6023]